MFICLNRGGQRRKDRNVCRVSSRPERQRNRLKVRNPRKGDLQDIQCGLNCMYKRHGSARREPLMLHFCCVHTRLHCCDCFERRCQEQQTGERSSFRAILARIFVFCRKLLQTIRCPTTALASGGTALVYDIVPVRRSETFSSLRKLWVTRGWKGHTIERE